MEENRGTATAIVWITTCGISLHVWYPQNCWHVTTACSPVRNIFVQHAARACSKMAYFRMPSGMFATLRTFDVLQNWPSSLIYALHSRLHWTRNKCSHPGMLFYCKLFRSRLTGQPRRKIKLWRRIVHIQQRAAITCKKSVKCEVSNFNPFTSKSDQCQISPAASPEILHHTV